MGNEVAVAGDAQKPLTAMGVVARVRLVQEVMKAVMKKDTHYGVIPGCAKPSLWKPGAEVLLVTFRIAPSEPKVEDLSTSDCIRYRVTRTGIADGQPIASAVGECSSDEEKYKWRFAVCEAEYEATPEDRRREKFKKDGSTIKQVRTNPADVANTILKMADKRAFIAMTLLATAASDCFSQDLEDLPPEIAENLEGQAPKPEPIAPPTAKTAPEAASEAHVHTFVPAAKSSKATANGKTRYAIKSPDGMWFSTFDDVLGGMAIQAGENRTKIKVTFKLDGEFKTIADIEPA